MSHRHLPLVIYVTLLLSSSMLSASAAGNDVEVARCGSELTVQLVRRCGPKTTCLKAGVVERITQETTRIWARLGVPITWSGSGGTASRDPSLVNLMVLLEEAGQQQRKADKPRMVLAAVRLPPKACAMSVVRVWVAPARRLMAALRVHGRLMSGLPDAYQEHVLALALGRALAHEIGHYLLDSADHRRDGLMRSSFAPDEWLDSKVDARYGLNALDLARVRSSLVAESGVSIDARR